MLPTKSNFSTIIIALFSTLALVPILVLIFCLIIKCRKEWTRKQRSKNQKKENDFEFNRRLEIRNEIPNVNGINYYNIMNSKSNNDDIGVYEEINDYESIIEANETVEYTQILE